MTIAATIFFISLVGIATLFLVKYLELKRQAVFAPILRYKADRRALQLKIFLTRARREVSKIGPLSVLITRFLVHEAALALAKLARGGERQAHRLADMVSHKRTFERREPRSEFLKQVSDRKPMLEIQQEPLIAAPKEAVKLPEPLPAVLLEEPLPTSHEQKPVIEGVKRKQKKQKQKDSFAESIPEVPNEVQRSGEVPKEQKTPRSFSGIQKNKKI